MLNKDYLLKAIDLKKQLRITLAHTTGVVEEAHQRHHTSATASAALGRVLTAALMMGSDLKGDEDILTLRINGNGMAGPIVATVDAKGNGRALISNPGADLPSRYPGKLAVGELVGKEGYLEVIKDLGLKQPFVGRVELVSGEIAEDLASYFLRSEQIPSLVSLGVLVAPDLSIRAAGGIFVQALPGAQDTVLELVEHNILGLGPVSNLIDNTDSLEDILAGVMQGVGYSILGERPLAFKCNCSRDRLAAIMASFSAEEIDDIYQRTGRLEANCSFCNQVYKYTSQEIKQLQRKKP